AHRLVVMQRYLLKRQRYRLHARFFSELVGNAIALIRSRMHRNTPLQVGQREGFLAVTAVGCADQREERVVFRNRDERAVAEGPTIRREAAAEHADFTDKGFTHNFSSWRL